MKASMNDEEAMERNGGRSEESCLVDEEDSEKGSLFGWSGSHTWLHLSNKHHHGSQTQISRTKASQKS